MEDGELAKLASEAPTLSDVARDALRREITKRKLGVALSQAAPSSKEEHPNLVTIRKFLNVQDAQLAKSVLESAGIDCFLADENTVRMDWMWSNAIDGVKLWVREEDADAADAILKQGRPDAFEVEGVGEYKQPRCPKCSSSDVSFRGLNRKIAYASTILLGLPIPLKHPAWKCSSCGYTWGGTDRTPNC